MTSIGVFTGNAFPSGVSMRRLASIFFSLLTHTGISMQSFSISPVLNLLILTAGNGISVPAAITGTEWLSLVIITIGSLVIGRTIDMSKALVIKEWMAAPCDTSFCMSGGNSILVPSPKYSLMLRCTKGFLLEPPTIIT